MEGTDRVEIGLLGPLVVRRGGCEVEVGGRLRAVLAMLAVEVGRPVSVERVARGVWSDHDLPVHVRKSVQTQIVRLRRLLGNSRIHTEAGGYRLDINPADVDVVRFRRLISEVATESDEEGRRRLLADALALWRGTPFEGVGSAWLDEVEAERMVELYLGAQERWVDAEISAGRYGAVVADLRELTARFPLREALWSRLLLALQRSGRSAEALGCYETVRVLLADELGVDPGPELKRQHGVLLQSESAAATIGEDEHHDRTQPPPSSDQIVSSDGAAVHVAPQQLPAARGVFVGRANELQALDDLRQEAPESAIVVLHGLGGIGKTTLALHWAHRQRATFPDGQLFIDLQGFGPGELIDAGAALRSLLLGLGHTEEQIPDDVDARSSILRSVLADRRCLIVLDNALDADHVRPLIPGSGSLAVVTSRNELRGLAVRDGAHRIALGQLAAEESQEFLRRRLPDWQARDGAVEELADLCGHVPLALSIAAARSEEDDLDLVMDDLRDLPRRVEALAVGDESGDLRAVFARSYETLAPEVAKAFQLLGLHLYDTFDCSAAAGLLGTSPHAAGSVLDSLADQHLLCRAGARRYEFHQLVRAYAVGLTRRDQRSRTARDVVSLAARRQGAYWK
ncbi:BTAD domain-containing putative transcriptional regulator [Kribbella lupini]|uniref:OmpR/PhoB-type domain-containing protein n=1 Tax=Kribbella lupini TaxID=291602 RepID=A0ABP4M4D1_9ACTN